MAIKSLEMERKQTFVDKQALSRTISCDKAPSNGLEHIRLTHTRLDNVEDVLVAQAV